MTPFQLGISPDESQTSDIVYARQTRLERAATALTTRLRQLHGDIYDKFLAVVYFDESHTLLDQGGGQAGRQPYFSLMHTLSLVSGKAIFFIFISTNSNLQSFAPTDALYPSIRVQAGRRIIPPFFELPFDNFSENFTTNLKRDGQLTLNGVCEIRQMVKFGRPM